MGEKNSHHLPLDEEKVLDFEVKDLTIRRSSQNIRKLKGVTEDDGLLIVTSSNTAQLNLKI